MNATSEVSVLSGQAEMIDEIKEEALKLAGLIEAMYFLRDLIGPDGASIDALISVSQPLAQKIQKDLARLSEAQA